MREIFNRERVLVEANAGTGKTTLIVNKYVDLLLKGFSPENIVLITFTEAAASELKNRVKEKVYELLYKDDRFEEALLYLPSAPIGTIHSFCFNILKTYGFRYRFFNIDSELLTDVEVEELLDFAVFDAIGSSNVRDLNEVLKHISIDYIEALNIVIRFVKEVIKHRTRYPSIFKGFDVDFMAESVLSRFYDLKGFRTLSKRGKENLEREKFLITQIVKLIERTYRTYEEEKVRRLKVGYNDLLEKTLEFLKSCDNAKEEISSDFRFIIIDEFQDTDPVQWEIVKELLKVENPPGLFLVGDPKQSIYRFRSADISIWKDAKSFVRTCFPLLKNYRSRRNLLSFFNELFTNIYSGEKKLGIELDFNEFLLDADEGGNVDFIPFETLDDFARKSLELVIDKVNDERIAVVGRKRKDLEPFEKILREWKVNFSVLSSNPFDTYGVREVMHLLKFINDPEDKKEKFFVLTSRFVGLNHSEAIECINGENCPKDVKEFLTFVEEFRKQKDRKLHSVFINSLLEETGYYDMLYILDSESYYSLLDFVNEIARFESKNFVSFEELVRYLEDLINSRDRTLSRSFDKGILLTTIHGSKGLEFETVIAVPWKRNSSKGRFLFTSSGMAVKLFTTENEDFEGSPLFYALKELDNYLNFQEEKNLLYVTLTRAKKSLLLGLRKKRKTFEFPYGDFEFKAKPTEFKFRRGQVPIRREKEGFIPLTFRPKGDFLKTFFPSSHEKVLSSERNPFIPDNMEPRDYGNAVHALCEAFVKGGEKEEALNYAINTVYSPTEGLVRRLSEIYDLLNKKYRFLMGAETEVPFTHLKRNVVVKGRIDLLVKRNGGYEIWDIKTGLFNEELFKSYSEQLKVYKEAFEKAGFKISSLKLFYVDEDKVVAVS